MNIEQFKLDQSKLIIKTAIKMFDPYAIIMAISGGDDSLASYYALRESGIKPDFILHVNTQTGIAETSQFVRDFADKQDVKLLYQDAGNTYENYVRRKGFPGKGISAHSIMYHLLKKTYITRAIASVRQRKRNRKILIVNGVRIAESRNRARNFKDDVYKLEGSNVWVNIIHYWEKDHCIEMIADKGCRNPVAIELCRSAECMCGTMQDQQSRSEAAALFPEWGKWLNSLEAEVMKSFPWRWGENMPKCDYL